MGPTPHIKWGLGSCSAWAASPGPPVAPLVSLSGPGVMPGPPSLVVSPHPGKTPVAHQFPEGKFVECYEPTVESSKSHAGRWVGGCLPGVPLPDTPVGPQVMRTGVPPTSVGGGLCPKTLCWGLRCPWNEVEVGLSLEGRIWGSQAAPLTRCHPCSCSWWTQPGR